MLISRRPWVHERFTSWMEDGRTPMLLLCGDPGSGKSSMLVQLSGEVGDRVVAKVIRTAERPDSFDAAGLLGSIIEGLHRMGIREEGVALNPETPGPLSVDVDVNNVGSNSVVVGVMNLVDARGRQPIAERLIRAVPSDLRVLIVIDALDQAEDDDEAEFLTVAAALLRAARGSGVRLLCASRRELPIGFDDSLSAELDLIADRPAGEHDLRDHLEERFESLPTADRKKVVKAIIDGAGDNWLWATTNAAALESEIAESGGVNYPICLNEGLEGLYEDGIRRIHARAREAWESHARPIVSAIAAAFGQTLTITELRWITGRKSEADIVDTVRVCEPFLRSNGDEVRTFHPDFARWVLAGNVPGISEAAGHLAVAKGFTGLGHHANWADVAANAANLALSHWCSVLLLDPFGPSMKEHEREIESIIGDPAWAERAEIDLEEIDQLALIAPGLHFPGSNVPLATGIEALRSSAATRHLIGHEVRELIPEGRLDEFEDVVDTPALAITWLENEVPGYRGIGMRSLWGLALRGDVSITHQDGDVTAVLSPKFILAMLDSLSMSDALWVHVLVEELPPEQREEVENAAASAAAKAEPGSTLSVALHTAFAHMTERRSRKAEDSDTRAALLNRAIEAHRAALRNTEAGSTTRFSVLVSLTNAIRGLSDPTEGELEELIETQGELADARRRDEDESWPASLGRVGSAGCKFALCAGEPEVRQERLEAALAAYREALAASPETDLRRIELLGGLANALSLLPNPSDAELDELIDVQSELLESPSSAGGAGEALARRMLGAAYYRRARRSEDKDRRHEDMQRALEAFRMALAAVPSDDRNRTGLLQDLDQALAALDERSKEELDELIMVRRELEAGARDAEGEEKDWARARQLLGDSLTARAAEAQNNPIVRDAFLDEALPHLRAAVEAAPAKSEQRTDAMISLNNALLLREKSGEELDELIGIQSELVAGAEPGSDLWIQAKHHLGGSYLERMRRRGDENDAEGRAEDVERTLHTAQEGLEAISEHAEGRQPFLALLADALWALDERTPAQADELVDAQSSYAELLHSTGNPNWHRAATFSGNALAIRADGREEDELRAQDLRKAAQIHREVRDALDPEAAVESVAALTHVLAKLARPTDAELDELIEAEKLVLSWRKPSRRPEWTLSAGSLGVALRERATRRDADEATAREEDLREALTNFRIALAATTGDAKIRPPLMRDLIATLQLMDSLDDNALNELIQLATELLAYRRSQEDADWIELGLSLSAALRDRAGRVAHFDPAAATTDRVAALAIARESLAAVPTDAPGRIDALIEVTNSLIDMDRLSRTQLDDLVDLQRELTERSRESGDPGWINSSDILGGAYLQRARQQEHREDRIADLTKALEAGRDAIEVVAPDHESRLRIAVNLANTIVVHAGVTRKGDREALDEAVELVIDAGGGEHHRIELTSLLPVVRAALLRRPEQVRDDEKQVV